MILWEFILSQNDLVFNPRNSLTWLLPADRTGRQGLKSVDWRAQTCTPVLAGGPVDWPGRPPESFCSLESPGQPDGRPVESSALCSRVSVDRPVDRWLNGQKSDSWPVDRAVDRQANLAPTASFSSPINLGVWVLFSPRFLSEFWDSFSNFIKKFSPLIWEQIFPIKRGVLSRVFLKWFSWVFLHHFNPYFLTQHLSHPLIYSSYRSVLVRGF